MAVTRSLFVRAPTILTRDVMSTPRLTSRCSAYVWRLLVSCCWRPTLLTRHIIPTPRSTSRCSASAPSTRTARRARRTSRRAMQPPCNRHVTVTCEKRDTRRGESSGDDGGGGGARATRRARDMASARGGEPPERSARASRSRERCDRHVTATCAGAFALSREHTRLSHGASRRMTTHAPHRRTSARPQQPAPTRRRDSSSLRAGGHRSPAARVVGRHRRRRRRRRRSGPCSTRWSTTSGAVLLCGICQLL